MIFITLDVVDAFAQRYFPKGHICLAMVFHKVSIYSLYVEEILLHLPFYLQYKRTFSPSTLICVIPGPACMLYVAELYLFRN